MCTSKVRSRSPEVPAPTTIPVLRTDRLVLTLPGPEAAAPLVASYRENEAHFAPTNPPTPANHLDVEAWRTRLRERRKEFRLDRSARFVAFFELGGPVVATCSLGPFHRGAWLASYLGYGIAARYEGQGLMTEAARAVIAYAFGPLGLHRLMANHLPENTRSATVLRRLGFTVEGYAKDYLYINGQWRDHVLNALVNPRPLAPSAP